MPHSNSWEEKGLCRIFTDKVSAEEVLKSNLSLHGDKRFDSIKYVINDFTRITDFEISDRGISTIVAVDNAAAITNPNIKIAIVSTYEEFLSWVELYVESMKGTPLECQIFADIDSAYRWVSEE